jgi:hypothetical protein
MRLVTDQKLVDRNAKIGKYSLQGGLVLLVGALVIDIYGFTQPQNSTILVYALAAFFVGLVLTNVSGYFNNRWGRRPDKGLTDALKGLDDRYALYNFRLGAAHVLLGPNGATVLVPKYQPGAITFEAVKGKGRWQAPGARRGPLGMFTNDPVGDPLAEAADEVASLKAFLKKRVPEVELAPKAIIVFMHPQAEISAAEAPLPVMHVKQLKDHIRRLPRDAALPAETVSKVDKSLGLAD